MTKMLICIPARYGSTRLPGKPLVKINGVEMIKRVWVNAQKALKNFPDCAAVVATDDQRIVDFCAQNGIAAVMTPESCPSGTARVLEAVAQMPNQPDFVLNLQGDNPLCPPWIIEAMLQAYLSEPDLETVTPVVNLTWEQLDTLRDNKKTTPFSGTTVVMDAGKNAFWFSKNIIPAIRKEEKLREAGKLSPIYRHLGVYGYRLDVLKKIERLPEGFYEKLEGLEQLRWLENRVRVKCVVVDYRAFEQMSSLSGVDSPEDVARVEKALNACGEF